MPNKKIYLASDHAGFALKEELLPFLRERGFEVEDLGPATFNAEDDYPETIFPLAVKIAGEQESLGVALGGSGQGEAMVCNRVRGVRAAVYYGPAGAQTDNGGATLDILASSRAHNNANVLCVGARFVTKEQATQAVLAWLSVPFSNDERHLRRIQKLDNAG